MAISAKLARFERFGTDWRRLLMRGGLMLTLGIFLVIAALFNPDAMIMFSRDLSWLPIAGMAVLALGFIECFDAALAKEPRDFFLHVQNGVLDVVVASLIVFSVDADPTRLSLLIAAFLMIKGLFRTVLSLATQSPQKSSTIFGAGISFLLGLLIWAGWPSSAGWFLALCLSIEIALRGWAIMMFAIWVKGQNAGTSASSPPMRKNVAPN